MKRSKCSLKWKNERNSTKHKQDLHYSFRGLEDTPFTLMLKKSQNFLGHVTETMCFFFSKNKILMKSEDDFFDVWGRGIIRTVLSLFTRLVTLDVFLHI